MIDCLQSIEKKVKDLTLEVYYKLLSIRHSNITYLSCFFVDSGKMFEEKAIKIVEKRIGMKHQFVLLPVNVTNDIGKGIHWFLCVADLQKYAINIYDSLPDQKNYLELRSIARIFEKACNNAKFTITHHKVIGQLDGHSCGLFCMLYAKYLLQKKPMQTIKNDIQSLRKYRLVILMELLLNYILIDHI